MNLDNLMDYLRSNGAVPEMIVVMPDGHEGTIGTLLQPYSQTSSEDNGERRRREYIRHVSYFVNDVIPFIESKYNVSPEFRAIAGLSMGGYQTTHLITTHPDLFHAAGIFSAGAEESVLTRFSSVKDHLSKYRLVYLSCGNWDFLFDQSKALSKMLNELGISHVYYARAHLSESM